MIKAVVWGVENTLLDIPNHIADIIPVRTAEAAQKLSGKPVDFTAIEGMARDAFNRNGMPCKEVAAAYELDEGILMAEMFNMVARFDVWPYQANFARPEQHWLNLFDKSADAGIKHYAVSSGSCEWGQRVALHSVGLDRFMSGVAGSEVISHVRGTIMNRYEAGAGVIAWLTSAHKPADVLVVDRDAGYIKDARGAGFKGVRLTARTTVAGVFQRHMRITADSRRANDHHVWAGIDIVEAALPSVQRLRAS